MSEISAPGPSKPVVTAQTQAELRAFAKQLAKLNEAARAKRAELKTINDKRARVQAQILARIESTEGMNGGFKHDGNIYLAKTRAVHSRIPDLKKAQEFTRVLQKHVGLANSELLKNEELIRELVESSKGKCVTKKTLVQKNLEW